MANSGGSGPGEPSRPTPPIITYREHPGGRLCRCSPARRVRVRNCTCWRDYSYPDRVVLAVVDERRRLTEANTALRDERQEMIVTMTLQRNRLLELEEEVRNRQEQTNTLHQQLQEVTDRLARVVQEVRDRMEGIVNECEVLAAEVININIAENDQVVPSIGSENESALEIETSESDATS